MAKYRVTTDQGTFEVTTADEGLSPGSGAPSMPGSPALPAVPPEGAGARFARGLGRSMDPRGLLHPSQWPTPHLNKDGLTPGEREAAMTPEQKKAELSRRGGVAGLMGETTGNAVNIGLTGAGGPESMRVGGKFGGAARTATKVATDPAVLKAGGKAAFSTGAGYAAGKLSHIPGAGEIMGALGAKEAVPEFGRSIRDSYRRATGKTPPPEPPKSSVETPSASGKGTRTSKPSDFASHEERMSDQRKQFFSLLDDKGLDKNTVRSGIKKLYGGRGYSDLTYAERGRLQEYIDTNGRMPDKPL